MDVPVFVTMILILFSVNTEIFLLYMRQDDDQKQNYFYL